MLNKVIGVDIGGTTIKFALFDTTGTMLDRWVIPTNVADKGNRIPKEVIHSIKNRFLGNEDSINDIIGVGIGVPGPVDDSYVKRAVNLGWENFPLKMKIEQELNVPVVLLNDANAAALGEFWKGSIKSLKNVVFVTIGTGVGGGIIVDGKILNGCHSSGGEIGHIPIKSEETRICGCGNTNCLESYGSANGMVTTMNMKSHEKKVSEAKEIFDLAREKNLVAKETISITVDYLASAIAGIVNTLDPEEIIIGGGVSEAGDLFLEPLKEAIDNYAFPQIRGTIRLRKAKLGNDAGIFGAAFQMISMLESTAIKLG